MSHTPGNLAHFTIHADDPERAMAFYSEVFGWRFQSWGPPGFWLIETGPPGDQGIHGALHARHEPASGGGVRGYECTIAVSDVDATARAIAAAGGRITSPRTEIPGVGVVIGFVDPEGHPVAAMHYTPVRGGFTDAPTHRRE